MDMRAFGWVAVAVVIAVLAVPAAAQQTAGTMSENFDTGQLQGWELMGGASVINVGRGNALVVGNEGFGIWVAANVSNFTMQYSYLPPQEGTSQVMFRMSGDPPNNSEYLLRHEGGQFMLVRHVGEQDQVLASQQVQFTRGQWQNVAISANGGQIQVSVGGQALLSANDPQPLNSGAVGFGLIFGMGVAYDAITITPQGGTALQPMTGTLQPQPQPATGTAQPQPGAIVQPQPAGMTQPAGGGGGGAGTGPSVSPGAGHLPPGSGAPMEAWLRIDQVIGGATAAEFKGWMDVSHHAFSIEAGPGNKRVNISPLIVTKGIDQASPRLRLACCKGEFFKDAELAMRVGGVVTRIKMTNVRIMAVECDVPDEHGAAAEVLTLSCGRIMWEVTILPASGGPGPTEKAGWDINANNAFY